MNISVKRLVIKWGLHDYLKWFSPTISNLFRKRQFFLQLWVRNRNNDVDPGWPCGMWNTNLYWNKHYLIILKCLECVASRSLEYCSIYWAIWQLEKENSKFILTVFVTSIWRRLVAVQLFGPSSQFWLSKDSLSVFSNVCSC